MTNESLKKVVIKGSNNTQSTYINNLNQKNRMKKRKHTKNKDKYIDLGDRGKFSLQNRLNELTGKEWIKFTKTWFIHRPKRRNDVEILHPAKFPESLIEAFIEFFTKRNQWVLDPFAGTGSSIVASQNCGRNGIGIDVIKKYVNVANKRIRENLPLNPYATTNVVLHGDSTKANDILRMHYPKITKKGFDFCITSPPYWNQLKRNSLRQRKRREKGLDTKYSEIKEDIGNEDNYLEFIKLQKKIFNKVYKLLRVNAYLVVITNNIYYDGKLYPLAFDTFNSLTSGRYSFIGKDEKIWCQDDKALASLGINNAWIGNRHHQYCLVFRKEVKLKN